VTRAALVFSVLLSLAMPRDAGGQTEPAKSALPKVVLVGDSIRLGYAPLVAKRLEGKAVVISPSANGGDSGNVLKHLDEWVIREKPDIVHLNCGLHDLKLSKSAKRHQVPLDEYERNLRQMLGRIRQETPAVLVFANTTPILDDRHAKRGADFDRFEADVQRYNDSAAKVMKETGIPIHDLHGLINQGEVEDLLANDGTHFTAKGNERLAEAVADCVLRHLIVRSTTPASPPAPGRKDDAEAYRKDEAERDALVPPAYRNLKVAELALPDSAEAWNRQRPDVLKKVIDSLGELPPRPTPPRARLVSRELPPGYAIEKIAIDNGFDGEVTALLLIPNKRSQPAPAVLWLHSSSPDCNQIITPNTNGGADPLGEVLVRAGYVVMSPDAYWHGDRAGSGPAGRAETGRAEHDSLFKLNLWLGRTLWGMFVRDDQIALDYLCSRPEVDRTRIGATGMSMGSTRAWWLAAVDERVACAVGVACLTRYQNLIAHGQLRQHGVYYFANGLLRHFDSEGIIALIAPRPFLALTGDLDAGSPADGIKIIEEKVSRVYTTLSAGDRFKNILYPNVGHTHTPEMRAETLSWFKRWLKPDAHR
jgi:lysophospholipase L1-like esterase/dienelactone hydrolase